MNHKGRTGPEDSSGKSREPRAVLWDMDGTILDSSECHYQAWREILALEHYPLSRERFFESFGQRNATILRDYFGPDLSDGELERMSAAKEARFLEMVLLRGVQPLPGVRSWLARLEGAGWVQAVASSAPRKNIVAILAALQIQGYFREIVASEDVQEGKPNPQVFTLAAERLKVRPSACIVVEDSPAGIEAARRAGMTSIGVLTSHSTLAGHRVVSNLADLPADTFDGLLGSNGV